MDTRIGKWKTISKDGAIMSAESAPMFWFEYCECGKFKIHWGKDFHLEGTAPWTQEEYEKYNDIQLVDKYLKRYVAQDFWDNNI
jgi:hypothetical protein